MNIKQKDTIFFYEDRMFGVFSSKHAFTCSPADGHSVQPAAFSLVMQSSMVYTSVCYSTRGRASPGPGWRATGCQRTSFCSELLPAPNTFLEAQREHSLLPAVKVASSHHGRWRGEHQAASLETGSPRLVTVVF